MFNKTVICCKFIITRHFTLPGDWHVKTKSYQCSNKHVVKCHLNIMRFSVGCAAAVVGAWASSLAQVFLGAVNLYILEQQLGSRFVWMSKVTAVLKIARVFLLPNHSYVLIGKHYILTKHASNKYCVYIWSIEVEKIIRFQCFNILENNVALFITRILIICIIFVDVDLNNYCASFT